MKRWLARVVVLAGFLGCWSDSVDEQADGPPVAATTATTKHKKSEKPRQGKWRPVRDAAMLTPEQKAEIEQLEALGYVAGSLERESAKVISVHDSERAQNGLNLYVSGHAAEATLMDMQGRERHRWRADFHAIWPDHKARKGAPGTHHFRRAKVLENGDLIAIYEGKGIVRLDRDSNVIWAHDNRAHHDLDFLPNGDVVTLTRTAHLIPALNKKKPILEDFLVVMSPDGEERKRVSVLRALEKSEFRDMWRRERAPKGDVFHTNTVHVLGPGLEVFHPAFKAGRILSSSRTMNVIFVVDLEQGEVVWAHRDAFKKQHDPRIVQDGGILLFDNVGGETGSRILEYELASMKIRWRYEGHENARFVSKTLGTAHRLSNGNTLITESEGGRAFEVSPDGRIVWEFFNPHRAGRAGRVHRSTIRGYTPTTGFWR